jgi:hypothetical protein
MNNSEQRNRNTRAKFKAGPEAETSRSLAVINSGPRQPAVLVPGSADFPVCCIAGFQTRKWRAHSSVVNQGIRSRFGNRRYSRFGNPRYRRDGAGHADGFWSLALAVRAGEKTYLPYQWEFIPRPISKRREELASLFGMDPHGSKVVLIDMNSLQNNSKIQIQRPGPKPAGRWSKPGFSPGLTGFGRVWPALTGYNFEQQRCRRRVGKHPLRTKPAPYSFIKFPAHFVRPIELTV